MLSRSTEANNQDKVSMGLNAALTASELTILLQQTLATELIALSNAAALRDETRLSSAGKKLLAGIRGHSPVLTQDRRLDHDLKRIAQAVDNGTLVRSRNGSAAS